MPRFFFHLRTARDLSPDEIGLELPDVEAAYLEAFNTARLMWSDLLAEREDPTRNVFEIADELGHIVQTVPFAEVLDSTRGRMARRLPHPARTAQQLADRTRHLAAALDEQIRTARQAVQRSQELLRASQPDQRRSGRMGRTDHWT